jgi:putative tryptophan/tyrosine transport system substrate-binding protein
MLLAFGAGLAMPLASFAQQQEKIRRIGFLAARARPTPQNPDPYYDSFVQGMRNLGYVEGKNLAIEWRFADGNYGRVPGLAAELVSLNPEVIVTHFSVGVQAAQRATKTIPIVSVALSDPVASGFAAGLSHPEGNITGLTLVVADIVPKQIEFLRAMLPKMTRLAFLVNPARPSSSDNVKSAQDAGQRLGINVTVIEARDPEEVDRGFAAMVRGRAEAVIVNIDAAFAGLRQQIIGLAAKHRLPSVFYYREDTQAGGLMSYGQNLKDSYLRIAVYVDKILKGAKPADLPIEQPTKIHLAINLKTAKALGIRVSKELVFRADEVIE